MFLVLIRWTGRFSWFKWLKLCILFRYITTIKLWAMKPLKFKRCWQIVLNNIIWRIVNIFRNQFLFHIAVMCNINKRLILINTYYTSEKMFVWNCQFLKILYLFIPDLNVFFFFWAFAKIAFVYYARTYLS